MLMKIQFDDPLFEAWTLRPILTIAEGGAEIGEIKATAARIAEADRDGWYREWTATADRPRPRNASRAVRGSARATSISGHQRNTALPIALRFLASAFRRRSRRNCRTSTRSSSNRRLPPSAQTRS
jgi:hypothetical protein